MTELKGIKRLPSSNCLIIRKEGTDKVLTVNSVDKYSPRNTGVFNVYLADEEEDKSPDNKKRLNQLWYYNANRRAFLSKKYPSKGLFEGFNSNLCVWKYKGVKNQLWSYDMNHHIWFNDFSKHALAVEKNENLITKPMDKDDVSSQWIAEPCKQ